MEFSSAIYRGDPCPEFSFSFKYIHMEKDIFTIKENSLSYGRGYVYSLQYHLV